MLASADHRRTTAKGQHQEIIDGLLDDFPEARTHGFMRALRCLPDAGYTTDLLNTNPNWRNGVRFTPDAFWVDPSEQAVAVYEAVHRHDIPDRKFARMNDIAWALDEDHWTLILVRADRFGRTVWNVRDASFVAMLERIDRGEPRNNSYHVPNWQKYTIEYCAEYRSRRAA